jgi:purine-cytosine permease-like protein
MAVWKYEHPVVHLLFLLNFTGSSGPIDLACRRFASGTLGPVTFGLGLRDSCLVILFFNLICAIPPAYL